MLICLFELASEVIYDKIQNIDSDINNDNDKNKSGNNNNKNIIDNKSTIIEDNNNNNGNGNNGNNEGNENSSNNKNDNNDNNDSEKELRLLIYLKRKFFEKEYKLLIKNLNWLGGRLVSNDTVNTNEFKDWYIMEFEV